ncbi:hypothetical protein I549_4278 [Mycobacterium avium subsp. avium 2285 (R)]|uniref:Uncharacterized protein n=1 Tax=Mycobacterium avium (strain 104) TaxID=243243 RepID=A0A0H2ZX45_MYCA1|nr:hypothetical protein MAV_2107 [Mycobacterium avium 104]EUA38250.1 hypothetical protein I549_4278 [Mycobacterium avium subsp. avium 2285 (R)]
MHAVQFAPVPPDGGGVIPVAVHGYQSKRSGARPCRCRTSRHHAASAGHRTAP